MNSYSISLLLWKYPYLFLQNFLWDFTVENNKALFSNWKTGLFSRKRFLLKRKIRKPVKLNFFFKTGKLFSNFQLFSTFQNRQTTGKPVFIVFQTENMRVAPIARGYICNFRTFVIFLLPLSEKHSHFLSIGHEASLSPYRNKRHLLIIRNTKEKGLQNISSTLYN